MIFFNQGNIFIYLECRHFKYQIFSTKPCGSQEIYWKYPILFDHAKRVFLVLPTTFNLVQRITVIVFFSIRGDCEEHNLAELFLSIEYWKQVILRWNSKRFPSAFAFQSTAPQRARICLLNPITAPGQMFSQRKMFNANTYETTTNIQIWSRAIKFEENQHLGKTSVKQVISELVCDFQTFMKIICCKPFVLLKSSSLTKGAKQMFIWGSPTEWSILISFSRHF